MESLKNMVNADEYQSLISLFTKGNIRNSKRIVGAPTGSISMLMDTSSSIEPVFDFVFKRKIKTSTDNDIDFKILKYYHNCMNVEDIKNYEDNSILPNENWVTCIDLDINDHLSMIEIFQKYACLNCSKTFLFSEHDLVDVVENFYERSWKSGLKGVTVYRNGSRDAPIIIENRNNNKMQNITTKIKKRDEIN
jgi:ribonucleoside-diphosphate reductase alpha chain